MDKFTLSTNTSYPCFLYFKASLLLSDSNRQRKMFYENANLYFYCLHLRFVVQTFQRSLHHVFLINSHTNPINYLLHYY